MRSLRLLAGPRVRLLSRRRRCMARAHLCGPPGRNGLADHAAGCLSGLR